VKLGKSADEKCEILTEEYATETLKKLGILEWHKRFKVGRESVEDPRRGVSTNMNRPTKTLKNRGVLVVQKSSSVREGWIVCQI